MITNILNISIKRLFLIKMELNKPKKRKKEEWIEKDLKSKIPKLDKKVVFVPSPNELNF